MAYIYIVNHCSRNVLYLICFLPSNCNFDRDFSKAVFFKTVLGSLCFSTFLFSSNLFYDLIQTSYFSLIFTNLHLASIVLGILSFVYKWISNCSLVAVVCKRSSCQTSEDQYEMLKESCSWIIIRGTGQVLTRLFTCHILFMCCAV